MKLLLDTHCTNEFFEGCDYAFVDLTPELAQLILQRSGTFDLLYSADDGLTTIEYYDCNEIFLDSLPDALQDEYGDSLSMGDNGYIELPESVTAEDFENHAARSECDRMAIGHTDVYWTAYPKHCDHQIETRPIDYATVRKAAGLIDLADQATAANLAAIAQAKPS